MRPSRNLAAKAGRWSARHRKTAILGWLAFVIVAYMIGGSVGTKTLTTAESGVGDSGRAETAVEQAFPKKAGEQVLFQSDRYEATDPEFRAGVADVVARLKKEKGVTEITSPYSAQASGNISSDRHSARATYEIPGDADETAELIDAPVAAVDAAAKAHPQLEIAAFGDASSEKEIEERISGDLHKAETTSLPITLLILVFAFGALVAAGIPVLLAMSGVLATFGLVGPISQLAAVDSNINQIILLIGLAVGVDYSLFYLKRAREERAAGRSEDAAIEAAAATSGRAVLISGFTVMIAMAGMYLAGAPTFVSFATGAMTVVAVSVIGSLTVLPALLSALGPRVDKGRIPFLGRLKHGSGNASLWSRVVDGVMRRPLPAALASAAVLIALAVPALGMHTAEGGVETLPKDMEVVQTFDRLEKAFPSEGTASTVVVQAADVTAGPAAAGIERLEQAAAKRTDLFTAAPDREISPDKSVAVVTLPHSGNGTDDQSNEVLDALRGEIVPATVGSVDGVQARVSGATANSRDFNDTMRSHLPLVFSVVLSAAFLLLLVTFRSIVIPIKAIVLNLLSVAAAYGVMVLVFQHGWGEGLLGFEANGAITPWVPLFLFVVLFGLSMDYHVFILTRVREAYDKGMSTEEAVSHSIKTTAGVVTSAALVMIGVFALFATLGFLPIKQMGVGLAVAVLLDATLVRAVLLPATMKLLGDRNWWLPQKLGWLPRIEHEPDVQPATA